MLGLIVSFYSFMIKRFEINHDETYFGNMHTLQCKLRDYFWLSSMHMQFVKKNHMSIEELGLEGSLTLSQF